jgi:hypothetical protein
MVHVLVNVYVHVYKDLVEHEFDSVHAHTHVIVEVHEIFQVMTRNNELLHVNVFFMSRKRLMYISR